MTNWVEYNKSFLMNLSSICSLEVDQKFVVLGWAVYGVWCTIELGGDVRDFLVSCFEAAFGLGLGFDKNTSENTLPIPRNIKGEVDKGPIAGPQHSHVLSI